MCLKVIEDFLSFELLRTLKLSFIFSIVIKILLCISRSVIYRSVRVGKRLDQLSAFQVVSCDQARRLRGRLEDPFLYVGRSWHRNLLYFSCFLIYHFFINFTFEYFVYRSKFGHLKLRLVILRRSDRLQYTSFL